MKSFRLQALAQTLPFLLIAQVALAQAPAKAPSRDQARAALNQPSNPRVAHYARQQIDQMVAPIALYPDQLLSQVLMAATYPQQVVEAAQWLKDPGHGDLKGDALPQALEPLPWDPSVKALVAFPQIIEMMNEHIEWTETLGVAFATQQAEVMSRVQALRQLAMKSGKLKHVRHLTVKQEGPAIVITSAEPDRVYVPVYNPTVVYGQWADREYPPVFLPPPQGFVAETIEPGFEVSVGYGIVRPLWGWSEPDLARQQDHGEFRRIQPDHPRRSGRTGECLAPQRPGGLGRANDGVAHDRYDDQYPCGHSRSRQSGGRRDLAAAGDRAAEPDPDPDNDNPNDDTAWADAHDDDAADDDTAGADNTHRDGTADGDTVRANADHDGSAEHGSAGAESDDGCAADHPTG